jgi:molybdopterin-biosynthesis enzyme MoeA-like protein
MIDESRLGVILVGDELLSGRRQDGHLTHVVATLAPRGKEVVWCRIVGDEADRLTAHLRESRQDGIPVVCFGGIGATPDDRTRAAAAAAFGVSLVRHAEAAAIIESRFGAKAWPHRIRMAELPEGSVLIPNPYNRIPGFTLQHHHFLPGFPVMAWPMLEWLLERYYPGTQARTAERAVRIEGVAESELIDLMEALGARFPDARFFSLPRVGENPSVELGVRARGEVLDAAFAALVEALERRHTGYVPLA